MMPKHSVVLFISGLADPYNGYLIATMLSPSVGCQLRVDLTGIRWKNGGGVRSVHDVFQNLFVREEESEVWVSHNTTVGAGSHLITMFVEGCVGGSLIITEE